MLYVRLTRLVLTFVGFTARSARIERNLRPSSRVLSPSSAKIPLRYDGDLIIHAIVSAKFHRSEDLVILSGDLVNFAGQAHQAMHGNFARPFELTSMSLVCSLL